MACVAVFVDAGYLFAQGSTALTGSKKSRSILDLNETAAIAELVSAAKTKCPTASLLRIYWYDAPIGSRGLSLEHSRLAHTDFVKLRLGFMNNQGQQKGVDSLIVTDLIELARNHAISDAVLLSGDEDVRIGVVIAQSFGVRVHLLGITPCRGSQSLQLMQESDTTTEWNVSTIGKFLGVNSAVPLVANLVSSISTVAAPIAAQASMVASQGLTAAQKIEAVVKILLTSIDSHMVALVREFWKSRAGVPPELDGKLLARSRAEIGRDLDVVEKRYARAKFVELFKDAHPTP